MIFLTKEVKADGPKIKKTEWPKGDIQKDSGIKVPL